MGNICTAMLFCCDGHAWIWLTACFVAVGFSPGFWDLPQSISYGLTPFPKCKLRKMSSTAAVKHWCPVRLYGALWLSCHYSQGLAVAVMLWCGNLQSCDNCPFSSRAAAFSLLGWTVPSLASSCFSLISSFFFFYYKYHLHNFFFHYKYYLHNSFSFPRPIKRSLGFLLAAAVDGFPQRPQHGPACLEFELG